MTDSHHAVLYCADSLEAAGLSKEFSTSSVDVDVTDTDRLSIAQVRELIIIAYQKPVASLYRTMVIVAKSIAPEAQHALLKILEEPPATSRFIIVLPHTGQLLPTLLSRLQIVGGGKQAEITAEFSEFLSQPVADRIATIAERAKAKDTNWMSTILKQASVDTHSLPLLTKKVLLTTAEYAEFKGASKKMLLEAIALSLPVKKS